MPAARHSGHLTAHNSLVEVIYRATPFDTSFHDMERNIAHVTLVYCCSRAANLELSVTAHNSVTGERLSL